MSHNTSLEAFQSQQTPSSKVRSSEFEVLSDDADSSGSLRHGRLGRRESILGIRNIFGRSNKKEGGEGSSIYKSSRSSSIRASIAEISHWPYGQQARSEIILPTTSSSWDPHEQTEPSQRSPRSSHGSRRRRPSPSATCFMPPLCKAYPQAVRHGVLPAPIISADVILRSNEKKAPNSSDPAGSIAVGGEHQASDMEKLKRKLRGDSMVASNHQWTTKTYVLVTSGHLLQYSGEGQFDRLPEKVLRLGHSSAAFASDIIPGRHWVLQVSSATDHDGTLQTESRSLFSRLPFRIPDKRAAANLLMVFESAEDMKEWITVLRSEIEKLGNKKHVSEAEMQREEDEADMVVREAPSRRTIISRRGGPGLTKRRPASLLEEQELELEAQRKQEQEQEPDPEPRASNCSTIATDYDIGMQDSFMDNVSVTNSVISHDGRQLDSLRESSNRYSYLSSGQRTVMTSTNSSPVGSPVLDRFPRPGDADGDGIPSRRMSQVNAYLSEEIRHDRIPENCPVSYRGAPLGWSEAGSQGAGEASSPARRISYAKVPIVESEASSPSLRGGLSLFPRSSLRKQLATIRTGRPLSTVEDQPSPKEAMPERPITSHHSGGSRPSTPPNVPALPRLINGGQHFERRPSLMSGLTFVNGGAAQSESRARTSRLSSVSGLRNQSEVAGVVGKEGEGGGRQLGNKGYMTLPARLMTRSEMAHKRRSLEPMEAGQGSLPLGLSRAAKRASICSTYSDRSSISEMYGATKMELPPLSAPPPSKALPPIPQRPSTSGRGKLGKKSSTPQLSEGPPPAPPPTCALPPIPQKQATRA